MELLDKGGGAHKSPLSVILTAKQYGLKKLLMHDPIVGKSDWLIGYKWLKIQ